MGKIVVTTNISLDGVVQDPDGEEGFRLGGWFGEFGGKDLQGWAQVEAEEAVGAEALLLGRRSDEWFASRWSSRDGAWADKLNSMPKYVVSSTLADPKWSNSTVIKGDVVSEVSKLKQEISGEILLARSGSRRAGRVASCSAHALRISAAGFAPSNQLVRVPRTAGLRSECEPDIRALLAEVAAGAYATLSASNRMTRRVDRCLGASTC